MRVSYNKLWKLLIDKNMKKVSLEMLSEQAKALLLNLVKMRMLRSPYYCQYVNV